MKEKMVSICIIILLFTMVFSGCFEVKQSDIKKNIGSIQKLINEASPGDIINIPNGIYYENIVIDKSITLIGEDKNKTIINGNGNDTTVTITADSVTFEGFKIQNSEPKNPLVLFYHGLIIESSNNVIKNNIIIDNDVGIRITDSLNTQIINNEISNNEDEGLLIRNCSDNIIKNNIVSSNNRTGVFLTWGSNNNYIENCVISFNKIGGVFLTVASHNNTIRYNNISKNDADGLELVEVLSTESENNIIYGNNFFENGQNINYISVGNAKDDNSNNIWYNLDLEHGNYWSDYTGTDEDSDGIGDIPYDIPGGNNQDLFPLMNPVDI